MEKHWLTRPETIRKLWIAMIAVLTATVLIQLALPVKGHFGIDGSFGFGAWFGFAGCVAMILFAKLLGALLKRRDDYYER